MLSAPSKVYTIPPSTAFSDAVAVGLLAMTEDADPLSLTDTLVLVPTRRAARSLREALVRHSAGRALLLPSIRAIGDVDEDDLFFSTDSSVDPVLFDTLECPPAMPELTRQMLLAQLIEAWLKRQDRGPAGHGFDHAVRLAASLGRLNDQVQTARIDFSGLATLVPDDYAHHWQATLSFLGIIADAWPEILKSHDMIDAADRRNRMLDALAELWREGPPSAPVIAAGSTGSIPATADLLAVVQTLPNGAVVLPGLDREIDDHSWDCLDDGHPQFGIRQLLSKLAVDRADVENWPWLAAPPAAAREGLISETMRPEPTTDLWHQIKTIAPEATDGLARIDCPDPQSEAGVIALLMREVLDTPARTAALVTRDRDLARRVAAQLGRWEVAVDDSAGVPLTDSVPGVFLRLIAVMAAEQAAPVPLLAALKHPLAAGGLARPAFLGLVRELERKCLRGVRPAPGFAGLKRALPRRRENQALHGWLRELAKAAAPFMAAVRRRRIAPRDLIETHIAFADWLARTPEDPHGRCLWQGDAGETAAEFMAALHEASDLMPAIEGALYPAVLDGLMASLVVRPRYGAHPRLSIWGPLEARLQQPDRVILGGLNEGSWPATIAPDPWLSRPMRRVMGLPAPERAVGLAAHDFAQLACAPEVFLTRSLKAEGSPTVPSRWLVRLDTVLARHGGSQRTDQSHKWFAWQQELDQPAGIARPVAPPAPRPPVAARPRKLSVTRVEALMRDPYDVFARDILKLRPLDPLDEDPGAAAYGSVIHDALDRFIREVADPSGPGAFDQLIEIGREAFEPVAARPGAWAFWWPRFERVARWFIDQEQGRRCRIAESWTERHGELRFARQGEPFILSAIVDRIDRLADGHLEIVDYKTGVAPSAKEVAAGYAPQLPLEAAMAAAGGFAGVPEGPIGALNYWRLTGGTPAGEIKTVAADGDAAAAAARDGLAAVIAAFDDPDMPYRSRPVGRWAPRYSDYLHLARVLEWSTVGAGEEP